MSLLLVLVIALVESMCFRPRPRRRRPRDPLRVLPRATMARRDHAAGEVSCGEFSPSPSRESRHGPWCVRRPTRCCASVDGNGVRPYPASRRHTRRRLWRPRAGGPFRPALFLARVPPLRRQQRQEPFQDLRRRRRAAWDEQVDRQRLARRRPTPRRSRGTARHPRRNRPPPPPSAAPACATRARSRLPPCCARARPPPAARRHGAGWKRSAGRSAPGRNAAPRARPTSSAHPPQPAASTANTPKAAPEPRLPRRVQPLGQGMRPPRPAPAAAARPAMRPSRARTGRGRNRTAARAVILAVGHA